MVRRKTMPCDPAIPALELLALLALLVLPAFLPACIAPAPERQRPRKQDYSHPLAPGERSLELVRNKAQYPDFAAAFRDKGALAKALDASIAYMKKPSARSAFPVAGISFERARRSLELFKDDLFHAASPADFRRRIERHFDIFRSVGCDGAGTVLFTGYCEPVIEAALERTAEFRFPLYRPPPDLVRGAGGAVSGRRTAVGDVLPYYTREEIDGEGALEGRGLELAWLKSALDAYIVHVQGSATLRLRDGSTMQVGYAGRNGRPYSSLGAALVRDGKIPRDSLSLDAIRAYFDRRPGELDRYLFENRSYIFFTATKGGPYGSIGAPVTPMRTIATDKSVFPRGSVVLVDTALPARKKDGRIVQERYVGFALDQDTGGAIRSAGRADIFFGTGDEAQLLAGRTRSEGRLYYLFAKAGLLDRP